MYKREEVYMSTLEYFGGDELATKLWIEKYCLKDTEGNLLELTPDCMHRRLAKEFARADQKYKNPLTEEAYYQLMKGFQFIVPQGSPMVGIGNNHSIGSISNCFVVGSDDDSYGGIMMIDQEQVQLMKRRGGVGHDLSHLRPKGATVSNAARTSSGLVSFAERYSNSTREVAQDGRRGALMLSVTSRHPDAEDFIDMKMESGKITGANVSIKADNEFMESATSDGKYTQKFGDFEKEIDSRKLFNKLVFNAWKSAEPGLLFWDTVLYESPARGYGESWKEKSTNPCGEIPLCPYDSCRLLAVNLSSYVTDPFTKNARLNIDMLEAHVIVGQRMMDNIVDLEIEKIDRIVEKIKSDNESELTKRVELELWAKIREKAVNGRRTGLGYTGLGDMMAMLNVQYGSKQGTNFVGELQQVFASAAYTSSVILAEERGAFPEWSYEKDIESGFINRMFDESNVCMSDNIRDRWEKTGRRNIGILTIAPTGTTSLMTRTSSGIEPVFSPFHFRKRKTNDPKAAVFTDEVGDMWEEYPVFHRPFIKWFQEWNWQGCSEANKGTFKDAENILSMKTFEQLDELAEKSPYHNATAQDVDYIEKVRLQGAAQKWVDHSISVTVNMPKDATVETVRNVYVEAWKSGCKGVTVYREGSRAGVLTTRKTVGQAEDFDYISAHKRPTVVSCDVHFRTVRGTELIYFVGIIDNKPYEIFSIPYRSKDGKPIIPKSSVSKGKISKVKGQVYRFESDHGHVIENIIGFIPENEQNQTRDYSLMLRHRVDPEFICDSISEYATISSFQKGVLRVLENYIKDSKGEECPECNEEMIMTEGCMKCPSCGHAKCG